MTDTSTADIPTADPRRTHAPGAQDGPTHPFEDEEGRYLVLVNDEEQHALWPADLAVPAGWHIALQAAPRRACLEYVEANWTDLRPVSVRDTA